MEATNMQASDWVALISAFLSFSTVIIMIITLKIQREHNIKSVTPLVYIYVSDTLKEISLSVVNCGLGPAIIHDIIIHYKNMDAGICLFPKSNLEQFLDNIIKSNFSIPANCIDYNVVPNIEGHTYIKQNSELLLFKICLKEVAPVIQCGICNLFKEFSYDIIEGSLYDESKPDYSKISLTSLEKFAELIKNDYPPEVEVNAGFK